MDCDRVNAFLNRYEFVLSAQMTKLLGKSIIILYSNLACSVLGTGNQQELSTDLFVTPFLTLLCKDSDPVSVGIITGKHYAKNSITKVNDRSNSRTCNPATRNRHQTEEPSES